MGPSKADCRDIGVGSSPRPKKSRAKKPKRKAQKEVVPSKPQKKLQQKPVEKQPEKEADTWVKVVSKGQKRRERKQAASASHNGKGKPMRQEKPKERRNVGPKGTPREEYVLIVRPILGNASQDGTSSDEVFKRVASLIDPVDAKIATRGTRKVAGGGVLYMVQSQTDLERLEAEMERTGLVSEYSVFRPKKRNPEIIVFGIDPDIPRERIVPILKAQNCSLNGVVLALRTTFSGKNGTNAILEVGSESTERLPRVRKLNMGWSQVGFRYNTRPIVCYKCWKYGHTQKVCRSVSSCGKCGAEDHVQSNCSSEPVCISCTKRNLRLPVDKKLSTNHTAGSRECPIYKIELERIKEINHGHKS